MHLPDEPRQPLPAQLGLGQQLPFDTVVVLPRDPGVIDLLREELPDDTLFGRERGDGLSVVVSALYQTERIDPVIERMLSSDDSEVRKEGGSMAAFAALQWNRPHLMERALTGDVGIRTGAAFVCSSRIDRSANSELNFAALRRLMYDEADDVREVVGGLATHLRGADLKPLAPLLADLIASPSFTYATPQLLITLEEAQGQVDELTDKVAHRFLDEFGTDVGDTRTAASADAHYISELVIRGLAQTDDKIRASALLDIIDRLLEFGVYGLESTLEEAERD